MKHLPACCTPLPGASPGAVAYAHYNAAGTPEQAGLNFRGEECPLWADLPPNVLAKWNAVAAGMFVLWDKATEDRTITEEAS